MTLTAESVPTVRMDIRVRNFRGTLVLAVQRQVFELDESAAFIWRQIDGTRSSWQIAERLAQEYSITTEDVMDDVLEVLDEWASFGAITV
ncbi:PqqD family protein [Streptomyces tirandamycinicus]|uniref:PqqD family protein n=1 Tax=Streptomyces tirandamycinicus TaxID=2174846 RepID=UPI0034463701